MNAATDTQHQCSCGRTFRHGISLKRHQKVSGCADTAGATEPVANVVAPLAPISVPAAVPAAAKVAEESFEDESGPVTITAQQIARWQEQKNFRPALAPVAEVASAPSVDWSALKAIGGEFFEFSGQQFAAFGRLAGSVARLGARFTVFSAFLLGLGWLCLFGISQGLSAAPTTALDRTEASEMAARSTVNSFLQTAQLAQFERARDFLTAKTRGTVSASDLRTMFSNLPIEQAPKSVSSALEQNGRVAKVTLVRGGSAEVYTLVQESQGWGLASVAVRRS